MEITKEKVDLYRRLLVLLVISLSLFGILMIYSSSYILAREHFGDSNFFLKRQTLYLLGGLGVLYLTSKFKFEWLLKNALLINLFFLGILILTLVPNLSVTVKGASRWVSILGIRIQPGEFIKFSLLLLTPNLFENFDLVNRTNRLLYTLIILTSLFVLMKQPDFGTFSICMLGVILIAFLSNFSRKKFYNFLILSLASSSFILILAPYRIQRLVAFLDPWKNAKTSGFQVIQSFLAFANGSLFGQGLGNGNEKLFYLPEAHNDFIFSVIGEELGFIGVVFVICAFVAFFYIGLKLSLSFKNRLSFLVASGIIFILSIQAALNMGVVLGLLPTKGLNLPFISFGGSSLISNFWALGLFMSAYRENYKKV